MTQPVASASQSAIEVASQLASKKSDEGTIKTSSRYSQGGNAKVASLGDQPPDGKATHRADSSKGAGKALLRGTDGTEKSDDGDASFEQTIDGIDAESAQVPAADAGQNTGRPDIVLAGQITVSLAQQESTADFTLRSSPSKSVIDPANLLKQESISALLSAKDRLVAGQAHSITNFAQSPTQHEAGAMMSTVVVNSRETHWNFNGASATTAFIQSGHIPTDAVRPFGTPDNVRPIASTLLNQGGAPVGAAVLLSLPATSKIEDAATKIASNTVGPDLVQNAQLTPASDASPHQAFDGGQGASNPHKETLGSKSESRVVHVDTAKSAELLMADGTTAPGATPGLTEQIKRSIVDALVDKTSAGAMPMQPRPAATPQVIRTLDLTLSPADLGSVRLKLSLKSNTLAIEAEASKVSTAQILHDDRTALERNLRDAGYDVATLKISDAAASNSIGTNSGQSSGNPFRDGDQQRPGLTGRQDGDLSRRDSSQPDQMQQRSKDRQSASAPEIQNSRQANALYV